MVWVVGMSCVPCACSMREVQAAHLLWMEHFWLMLMHVTGLCDLCHSAVAVVSCA